MPPRLAVGAGRVRVKRAQLLLSEVAVRAMLWGMAQLMVPGDTPCLALLSCSSSSMASGIKLSISAWAEVPLWQLDMRWG